MIYSSLRASEEDKKEKLNSDFRDSILNDKDLSKFSKWDVVEGKTQGMLEPKLRDMEWELEVNSKFGTIALLNKGVVVINDKNDFKSFKDIFDQYLKVKSLYSSYVKKWDKLG